MPTGPLEMTVRDEDGVRDVRIEDGSAEAGRDASTAIRLRDALVSRRHGRFELRVDGWHYADTGSRNGSFLNGERLEPNHDTLLRQGDTLRLGTALLVVSNAGGAGHVSRASLPAVTEPPIPETAAAGWEAAPSGAEAVVQPRLLRIGRAEDNDLVLGDPLVSGHHLEAWIEGGALHVRDLGSRNGTFLGEEPITETILPPEGVLRLGRDTTLSAASVRARLEESSASWPIAMTPGAPEPAAAAAPSGLSAPSIVSAGATQPAAAEIDVVRVGRAIDNDIVIADPLVSSYHLEAWPTDDGIAVRDLNSRNGTYVGEERIGQAVLPPSATLRLGRDTTLTVAAIMDRILTPPAPSLFFAHQLELEHLLVGEALTRVVGKEQKVILDSVDISIKRGQFVAIAGGSGTGKTTLVKVLNGYTPPDSGQVLVAPDQHGEFHIGFVPQDDVIHRELALKEGLVLSAMLRYPPGTARATVEQRADEVLSELGLSEHTTTLISRLSGGQRKRASVALELMTRPRLILLDEPTSGLDPASDRRLIRLLRALADSGYGVAVVTHNVANIAVCDTVAFLARGGHLVFSGSPDEAKEYFGTEGYEEIYEKIESESTPQEWRQRFEASEYHGRLREAVRSGQEELGAVVQMAAAIPPQPEGELMKWQLKGLATRYVQTLLGDRRNLYLLLGQVPIIVLLARILFSNGILKPTTPDEAGNFAAKGLNLLFILGAMMVWLGTINAAREICKEIGIWERERHAGVRPLPYLLSKVLVLGGLCGAQTIVLALLTMMLWKVPGGAGAFLGILVIGWLTALSGVTLGLVISASVPTADRAVAFVPLAMIPQIMFGGTIIPISDIGGVGKMISSVVSARWAFEGLGRITNRAGYIPEGNKVYDQVTGPWIVPVLALVVLCLVFGGLAAWLVIRQGGGRAPGKSGLLGQLLGGRRT